MTSQPLGGEGWTDLFRRRNTWQLTNDTLHQWIENNTDFFHFLSEFVPPRGRVIDLGCGPGRHSLSLALMGYCVVGVDVDPEVIDQARINAAAVAPDAEIEFIVGDIHDLSGFGDNPGYDAVIHGGVMEHFPSMESIRDSLSKQLQLAPYVIFDVPIQTEKNLHMFENDQIFRNIWSTEEWVTNVLHGFDVRRWTEVRRPLGMVLADEVVLVIARPNS